MFSNENVYNPWCFFNTSKGSWYNDKIVNRHYTQVVFLQNATKKDINIKDLVRGKCGTIN